MIKKKKSRRVWQLVPSKPPKPDVPESTKIFLSREANKVIETVIKPKYLEPPPIDNDFNYIADIYSRWYRNYFYFVANYNCPSPNAISPSFESKYVRLEYVGEDKYNFAYMRHTGQWWETHRELSMLECLNMAKDYPPY